ncbi:asparagine-linked glycosylation 9 protein isoform a [Russula earlei]|uniref:Asparagine-linked glycosylation 9 protein isoform a n=1 Tax=Russula earlei TaxID=71964 RepID=A0ACC0UL72_9AGAM|nr:asparagine-linked glycosylation 9 protein isoform a [Russula earlei]
MSKIQTLRFRRPIEKNQNEYAPKPVAARHTGILQDQLGRASRPPWVPRFSVAVRILLIFRVTAAMYSNIQDCDEVFNYWEPLHYLYKGYGFQTWETAPQYAIRSWAYTLLWVLPSRLPFWILREAGKRPAFFLVRAVLGTICTICEAKLYDTVRLKINNRVARYMLFMLAANAGMWSASNALLPSSFAMYTTMLALSHAFIPPSNQDGQRTLAAVLYFAFGAVLGWPFALALAIPFVLEELFVFGADQVAAKDKFDWQFNRWIRLLLCGAGAAFIPVPIIAIDSYFYGKFTAVFWNIVSYNVFPDPSSGPDLYGTEPWYFYLLNLSLNFNILLPMALFSLPALAITYRIDRRRLGYAIPTAEQSSPFRLLGLRLLPLYTWIGIMSVQPHKEERFMYPVYPLVCFNAAVMTFLLRGWIEVAYIKITKSPYRASRSQLFRWSTLMIVLFTAFISTARILALWKYYHTPMTIVYEFEKQEVPRLLNVTGLLDTPLPPPELLEEYRRNRVENREDEQRVDLSPIKDFKLRICYGKEWYRFPGHYLVPDGVRIDWIKSEFDGILPAHFYETYDGIRSRVLGTRHIPAGLNDLNREEPMHYVDVTSCDYVVDLDFPHDPIESMHEPRYILDDRTWERVTCLPFLDARHSSRLTRAFWLPGHMWQSRNRFGEYCLLRNKTSVEGKIREIKHARSA